VDVDELRTWAERVLTRAGASAKAASTTAACLVDADSRGVSTHGVALLPFFAEAVDGGHVNGSARPWVVQETEAMALVDGDVGLGPFVATFATELCCTKALAPGVAAVGVRNSTHFGAASYYAALASRRGLIGVAVTNSAPAMAPLGSRKPILGTNPIAIAAPGSAHAIAPSLDIATSVVAAGRIALAAAAGAEIPADWAIDRDGRMTRDADEALRGAVLPMAQHKGFGLAFMIDVLSACLTGAIPSPNIGSSGEAYGQETGIGHFFFCLNVEAFTSMQGYENRLDVLTRAVHEAPRAGGSTPLLVPGEPEVVQARESKAGIVLPVYALDQLSELGHRFDCPPTW